MASTTVVDPSTTSTVANVTPLVGMEAKMIVATGHDHCQQLKDMVSKEDPSTMVVVMASSNKTSKPIPSSPPVVVMDPGLLAVASSGSWKKLQRFLNGEKPSIQVTAGCCCCVWMKWLSFLPADPRSASSDGTVGCCCWWKKWQPLPPAVLRPTSSDGAIGSSAIQQPPRDLEAHPRDSILDGVTAEGDTFLHVMASNVCDNLDDICLIRSKAILYISKKNNNRDTPIHCAARAGNLQMVNLLIDLAKGPNTDVASVKTLLETENNSRWTVLHEAVRVGGDPKLVKVLMAEDPDLATIPKDATSPLYLAILLEKKAIAKAIHEESKGNHSYSGPNGQNALHAAVLRGKDLTEMLLGWDNTLTLQQDENGSTPLHLAASMLAAQMHRRTIRLLLLKDNPDALYQPDNDGFFPTHVAASMGATLSISHFLKKSPRCAGLRDARGRTYLHVAIDKRKIWTVRSACLNQSLSWILNVQDNDGNTALHLAVQKGSLRMFCALLGNGKVLLNLTNEKGETALDIAHRNVPRGGLYYNQNSESKICFALENAGAKWGIFRKDYVEKNDIGQSGQDEKNEIDRVKDSTQNLCIGSVLIATVTFGATFAMPGGYRADDHPNGGTPTLAGRYTFDAFITANALAFVFSTMATIGLMASGSPAYNLRSRVVHLRMAFSFMLISVISLVAAFALGTYVMLAPVAHMSAITVCVLSSLVLLYAKMDVAIKNSIMIPAIICRRLGICHNIVLIFPFSVLSFLGAIIFNLWPIVVIFCLPALKYAGHKVESEVQPPVPLA